MSFREKSRKTRKIREKDAKKCEKSTIYSPIDFSQSVAIIRLVEVQSCWSESWSPIAMLVLFPIVFSYSDTVAIGIANYIGSCHIWL
jgi:hypothetical protein